MAEGYKPQNTMSLWWLGEATPARIGQLVLADTNRKVGLEYDPQWLAQGFALSDDMPLAVGLHLPVERDTAVGAVDDARPDRWGERVIRHLYKPPRMSILEQLYFAGDNRFGALGVSLAADRYAPCGTGVLASFDSLDSMERAVAAVLAGEKLSEELARLVRPGPSFGGVRPKSAMQMHGHEWVVKFSEGEDMDTARVEHASMTLAAQCGISVATTLPLPLARGHALAIQRFDRGPGALRWHVQSAYTALRAAGSPLGYPELAQLLRRVAHADAIRTQQHELFRRMVFNIAIDNTDDHEKNHALVRSPGGGYALSPAYDVLPTGLGLGYQQMRVGKHGTESSLDNALSEPAAFGLNRQQATVIVKEVCAVVNRWKQHFLNSGVQQRDIDALAAFIDGAVLAAQRQPFL